jgi:hypothetical protein
VKALGRVEVRCRKHEDYDQKCASCDWLRRSDQELSSLRNRRNHLIKRLREHLAKGDLTLIDLK